MGRESYLGEPMRRGPLSRFVRGLARSVSGIAAIAVTEVITAYLKGGENLARQVAASVSTAQQGAKTITIANELLGDSSKLGKMPSIMQNADYDALKELSQTLEEKVEEDAKPMQDATDGAEWLWPGKLGVIAKESTNVVMFSYIRDRMDLHVVFCNEREREAGPGEYKWVYPRYYIYPNVDYRTWYSLKIAPSAGEWFWRNMIEKDAEFIVIWGPMGNGGRSDPTANPKDLLPNLHLGDI